MDIADEVESVFERNGVYFCSDEEAERLAAVAIDCQRHMMSGAVVGQPATRIAELADIKVPAETKILGVRLERVGPDCPLSREKLSPILGFYRVATSDEGLSRCQEILAFGGLGHTAVVYARDADVIEMFQNF